MLKQKKNMEKARLKLEKYIQSKKEQKDRQSRKKDGFMKALFSGKDQHAQTPLDLLDELNREFGPFGEDPCPNGFSEDGLKKDWAMRTYINVSVFGFTN